jgi:ABC-type glutathione transport system ATPase component
VSRTSLLEVRDLSVEYVLRGRAGRVRALDGVGFRVEHGECLALVGASGSGKSTIGRALLGLVRVRSGSALWRRTSEAAPLELLGLRGRAQRAARRELGIVFQDPFQSLNPRRTIGEAVSEPLRVHGLARGSEALVRAAALLERVGLGSDSLGRFPHEFSGGQRQRVAIARALALAPRFLVLDEAVSALDVSVRAQILNLLLELRAELGLSYLFITHDLALARIMAESVVVLADGRVVESGPIE